MSNSLPMSASTILFNYREGGGRAENKRNVKNKDPETSDGVWGSPFFLFLLSLILFLLLEPLVQSIILPLLGGLWLMRSVENC